jgi:hypothetical protein
MPDRYEEGLRALQVTEVPDQWDDIRRRADGGLIVTPDGERAPQRRRWPLLFAAAALTFVVGMAALLLREQSDVTTDPAIEGPAPPTGGQDAPSTSALPPTTRRPSTTEAPADRFGACPRALELTTTTAPPGWSTAMEPAEAVLPSGPPAGVDRQFAGLFAGPTSAQNVFVVAGLPGIQDDSFVPFPGPVFGGDARIAPFEGGWYLEVAVPHPSGACWLTLEAIGMTQQHAIPFAQGLRAR